MSLIDRVKAKGPKKILALDGGGIRRMMTVEILSGIETMLRKALGRGNDFVLADYFDLVAGTSTGAIIATCVSLGMPVAEIRDFYVNNGKEMFDKAFLLKRFKNLYEDEKLSNKLREVFGAKTTFGDKAVRTLLLVVTRNATTDSPWPLSNNPFAKYNQPERDDCNLRFPLWQLVRASTAAPVFFPPEKIKVARREFVFVDGGVTTYNNPAFLAFLMATVEPYNLNWEAGEDKMLIVSVGTGSSPAAKADLNPGVKLRRSIAPRVSNEFEPFLLFDHFAFNDPLEGPLRGFPYHPHRGIETVTYMLEGATHHRDSLGNQGTIGPGDVQWVSSGRGILHEEMPRRGPSGNIYGFQLWVNLPSHLKMSEPRYQEVTAATIPTFEKDGVKIRVVAGTVEAVTGPVTDIAASPLYMDVELAPGLEWDFSIPAGHTLITYVFEGEGIFSGETISAVKMLKFSDGDCITVKTENHPVRFMLMAGAPFQEPIVPYGPFVMNTIEEIQETLKELRNGTFIK